MQVTFDKMGRVVSAVSGRYNNIVAMNYDMAGRKQSESLTIAPNTYTTIYDYNNLGQRSKLTYPDGTIIDRTYTERGQLHEVKYAGTVIDTRAYDVGGRQSSSTYNNGVVTTYNYRNGAGKQDNLIDSIVTTNTGTEKVGTYTYAYDANKNKTAETISNSSLANKSFDTTLGTDADGYDDDDRLTYWERSDGNRKLEWALTDVGDWSALSLTGIQTSRTHNDAHELTAVGTSPITYDVKGNLKSDATKGQDHEWDFENRLTKVVRSGESDLFAKYDALGRRVQWGPSTSTSTFVYAGLQMIARYDSGAAASSPKQRFVYGSYIDEPILTDRESNSTWSQYYYSRNQQYSITALTDTNGNVVERYTYDPYGNTTIYAADGTTVRNSSSYDNNFAYTGRYFHPDLSVYFFRARMYDPELGRFISRDPLGYVDGTSLYGGYFAANSLDPFGTKKYHTLEYDANLTYATVREAGFLWSEYVQIYEFWNINGKMTYQCRDGNIVNVATGRPSASMHGKWMYVRSGHGGNSPSKGKVHRFKNDQARFSFVEFLKHWTENYVEENGSRSRIYFIEGKLVSIEGDPEVGLDIMVDFWDIDIGGTASGPRGNLDNFEGKIGGVGFSYKPAKKYTPDKELHFMHAFRVSCECVNDTAYGQPVVRTWTTVNEHRRKDLWYEYREKNWWGGIYQGSHVPLNGMRDWTVTIDDKQKLSGFFRFKNSDDKN